MNRKKQGLLTCPPNLHGQGHGPLKFTWKWRINLSHLSTLTPSNSAGLNQDAVSMHLNDKFHLLLSVVSRANVIRADPR